MKLFYQLTADEKRSAIEICADLVATDAVEQGLQIEVTDDEAGEALKRQLQDMLDSVEKQTDLVTKEQKIEFLMQDEIFADTIFELAEDMAKNGFYHDDRELVIRKGDLDLHTEASQGMDCDCEDPHEEPDPQPVQAKKNYSLN